jgi:hypothetical protein
MLIKALKGKCITYISNVIKNSLMVYIVLNIIIIIIIITIIMFHFVLLLRKLKIMIY